MNLFLILGAVSETWQIAGGVFFGIVTGAILAAAGFTDGDRVRAAFKLSDKAITLAFLATLFFGVVFTQIGVHAGWITLPEAQNGFLLSSLCGGAICGIGLRLSGLGPLSALGSVATGNLGAISGIVGMILAIAAYRCWNTDFTVFFATWDKQLGAASLTLDFFHLDNPALWLAAGIILLIFIIQFAIKGK